jgi:hypothetical protein
MRHCKVFSLTVALSVLFVACWGLQSNAFVSRRANKPFFPKVATATGDSTAFPNAQQRVQRIGNINMCQTNFGMLGSSGRDLGESPGGCFNPHPDSEAPAPSFEFPKDSGLDYLFFGALWVGATVDDIHYVSTGCDGWEWINEMFPDGPAPSGAIEEASRMTGVECYSPGAMSDQDMLGHYTDTIRWETMVDRYPCWNFIDGRWHRPLGLGITQTTHSWSEGELSHIILGKYDIKNIGQETLQGVCVGLFLDTDIGDFRHPYSPQGCIDDITGFLRRYETSPGDTEEVNIAWAADNDGWVESDSGLHWSVRGIIGAKILSVSYPEVGFSYNWWVSDQTGTPRDWGPWTSASQGLWAERNCYAQGDSFFPNHALGTPDGDCSKYFMMQNGEIDYDQVYSCTWASEHPEQGWLAPNERCDDFADGADTKFLLSFGPIDQLAPGATVDFAVAYIIGENFHTDPDNGQNLPENPDSFYAHVDFSDLVQKALVAQRLYDSLLCSPTSVEEPADNLPFDFVLSQNYPNPFNPETRISYTIVGHDARSVPVSLKIYNILGQSVRTLVDQPQSGGKHEILWDGKDESGKNAASGVYFYRLQAGESVETKRMVLIR